MECSSRFKYHELDNFFKKNVRNFSRFLSLFDFKKSFQHQGPGELLQVVVAHCLSKQFSFSLLCGVNWVHAANTFPQIYPLVGSWCQKWANLTFDLIKNPKFVFIN